MGVTIKNAVAEQLIRELAALTGETKTEALTKAARERLERLRRISQRDRIDQAAHDLQESLVGKEPLSTDALYNAAGLPG
ncbi:MAG: type II toxin-antitoxin system VapB family antitoxin [Candidatus Nanopelagicales bacterium]|nr:type II toxin-antitoxin system VapB family antitoxin [Candidatus Nanopelagicales bacterium]MDZ4250469.1 type II toxin-antitoxin system VapB family antitoxin [Candidatus Nanopelagicales bacterium]MDZ7578165.1 type II toxin-antitoxin system VapB family antitoxin [Candidatus Nanopelagicales bacterium]